MLDSKNSLRVLSACLCLSALAAGCAAPVEDDADVAVAGEALSSCGPTIPDAIAAPAGNKLAFMLDAEGVQIYACNGTAWALQGPDADLFNRGHRIAGSHYAGPTWEALDGSTVVGSRLAGVTVDPTAIPWLLLQAVSHAGEGRMAKVSYIQRLSTVGGLAPAAGCDADHVGALAEIDYTATYAFYEPKQHIP
jgi:hypothetical protein